MQVNEYLTHFAKLWDYIQAHSDLDGSVEVCAEWRGYGANQAMQDTLRKQGIAYIDERNIDLEYITSLPKELGLLSKNGTYIHTGRFVLPIRDIAGNVLALVGWFPDKSKYITSNSMYFSKGKLFYGMENLGQAVSQPRVPHMVIVEGIFDRLAVESKGISAVATMGINLAQGKRPWYNLMGRVVGVPDMDTEGVRVRKSDAWGLRGKGRYMSWNRNIFDGEEVVDIKDIDTLLNVLPQGTAKAMFGQAFSRSYKMVEKFTF